MLDELRLSLASDLEALGAGAMNETEFREKYHSSLSSPLLVTIWPGLEHYFADADIRLRDSVYSRMQQETMRRLAALLRTDASEAELQKMSFLSP
jgi:hypothetical protein